MAMATSQVHCPHCHTELPDGATFCANCGRRVSGWSGVPATAAAAPAILPGSDEPTTQMTPTPSLLRAAAVVVRRPRWPLAAAMLLVAASAGAVAYRLSSPRPDTAPPPPPPPAPATPTVTATTALTAAPAPPAAKVARPAAPRASRGRGPHRMAPLTVAAKSSPGAELPHKTVASDSRPLAAPTAKPAPAAPPPEDLPTEATPLTEEEQKAQAEASIDADQVRFVVQQHLPQVHACYARAFKDGSPGGRVEIGFAVTANGTAARVRVETNSTDSEGLAHCLEARIKEWQFPRPIGGEVELIYPFVFSPGS
jgi:hypothetical protein